MPPPQDVRFVGPVERVTAASLPELSSSITLLAAIDPTPPLDHENAGQTLSLFGREDLIAASSTDYQASRCAPLKAASDVLTEIERRARETSVVIITESHQRSEHRGFSTALATRLLPLGFDTLALETLSPSMPGTPERYLPSFVRQPRLPYFEDGDGHYLAEAGYGRYPIAAHRCSRHACRDVWQRSIDAASDRPPPAGRWLGCHMVRGRRRLACAGSCPTDRPVARGERRDGAQDRVQDNEGGGRPGKACCRRYCIACRQRACWLRFMADTPRPVALLRTKGGDLTKVSRIRLQTAAALGLHFSDISLRETAASDRCPAS
jgi:hypothetical protein